MPARRCGGAKVTSRPLIVMVSGVGWSRPAMVRNSVDAAAGANNAVANRSVSTWSEIATSRQRRWWRRPRGRIIVFISCSLSIWIRLCKYISCQTRNLGPDR